MADVPVQVVVEAGITPAYAAAAAGDTVPNDGLTFLHFKNTNAAARNVTITSQQAAADVAGFGALPAANRVINVPANVGDKMAGPFPPLRWNDANGKLALAYDALPGLTVAAVRVPRAS